MIHKGVPRTFFLYAYNYATGSPQTGDANNITVYKAEDNNSPVQITATIVEIDSTNMPGWYRFTTTLNGDSVALSARSSTSGVNVIVAGLYLNNGAIPSAVAGSAGGLPVIGQAPLTNLDIPVSSVGTSVEVDGYTPLQHLAIQSAVLAGELTGTSTSVVIKSIDDLAVTRVYAEVDEYGNRISVTVNPPT
jgi:hypothetical protein